MKRVVLLLINLLILATCTLVEPERMTFLPPSFSAISTCAGRFVTHELDHTTTVPGGDAVRMFEANGSGVAVNDLDNDGDLDIVLANHQDPNTILWNEGRLTFRTERMEHGDSRAVTIVDVDGDGWLDIVFSRRASAPNYWRNVGDGRFVLETLSGVNKPLYSLNWGDLDGDGDLDLVGGTYDAGLLADRGQEFLHSGDAGVYYYENDDGTFRGQRLADQAQALAMALVDLNEDGQLDILVGNDFAVPDFAWVRTHDGWRPTMPFAEFTHSTMSYDAGDVNNDGQFELFSTDMKPYADDRKTAAAWYPVMESMMEMPRPANDPQVMENVLQVATTDAFADRAADWGIDATGWSWSGKFGDLDQDGFLDLYVVNGMMESTTFAHLPRHELVEENQAFRNVDGTGFAPAPDWSLNSQRSGRGMSMGDLDNDGDLDIVVNNLRGAAQLFENQLCTGSSLEIVLNWPGSANTHALGATLTLQTDAGEYTRQVRAASGYLSGDPARIHFGIPSDATVQALTIRWPDGTISVLDEVAPGQLITITRS